MNMESAIYLLAAGVTTSAAIYLLLRMGWALRIAADIPNHRSMHQRPIPRVGGAIAIPVALLPALVVMPDVRSVAATGLLLWALSFVDDIRGLSVIIRLTAHAGAALALLAITESTTPLLMALSAIAIVWGTNLFNFMDGADGLAAGMAVSGFSAFALAAMPGSQQLAGMAALLAAVSAGFLPFNFPPARIFLGDAGSIPLGFLMVALGIFGWQQHAWPLWFPPLVFSPFITDATVTLLKRALRREPVWQAHREHYYQRLIRMGWSRTRLALIEYSLMIAAAASALAMLNVDRSLQIAGLVCWILLYATIMIVIDTKWERHQVGENVS